MQITISKLEKLIYVVRGHKVMLDSDLAKIYNVEIKRLNEQVKRNSDRFPEDFMFQLSIDERNTLRSQIATFEESVGQRKYLPYVFTEQGVAMLSSVLNGPQAIKVNIQIMRAFVQLRELTATHKNLAEKIEVLEKKYDKQFKIIFDTLRDCLVPALDKERKKIGLK